MPPSDPSLPLVDIEDIDHHLGSLLPAGQYSAAPPTPVICPNCGGTVPEGSRFCGQCGRALGLPMRTTTEATVTVLFTDIQGFSNLTSSVGDQEALDALKRHNQIVRAQIQNYGGAEIKYQGDGFMVAFPSARRAVLCAIDIQRKIAEQNRDNPDRPLILRMGLNSGDVLRDEQDLFGAAVNLAARIAEKAKGNQILISELVKELAGPYPGFKFADRGKHAIKGFPGRYKIYEVAWQT
ncbi:MAG TPA: adenylate/guanylate cyclase domain-containing protein [Coriobacteriia bacterium]